MIGLIAFLLLGALLALAYYVFAWTYRANRRRGKSDAVSLGWGAVAVLLLLSPTWEAIPTWIAYEYYNKKEAGVKVFKTLDQWKAENPGVTETLNPYAVRDKRGELRNLGNNKFRKPLNERFAQDNQNFDKLFLSVYAHRYSLIDVQKNEVLVSYVEVGSGNAGGFATGGAGWWAFWLIHEPTHSGYRVWSAYRQSVENMGTGK